ncbi:50S ribosomal protein L10 [Candidatus Kaiserbacteria bacterium RIFCSPHIGHO2_02_FULL_55_25]|uniref:Large ribosomal subunit protein uL10 n=1 Tax=Candidatus Kaiserbacteria bacterium RIFCSPHIGHO2_02_FULL_55_25 TaxID=1798498 RepID=A0A1F6E440_9BACT|nr:MAG: 50S ribosomal protein L10 [Candidatus Kaiserbacteria bacterium RIFCSPHIGHO2_01_FULL_55_79]OGG68443.1 MAG: 50S ribosomal protein L10 [Candidatus Kaiserbacteria bacterium RIFCSPHIGHO2_02_FULL_55_25]OGG78648.1 MAG: 50S ribosomal protein L10 [Candidatus Kaiserbacteria bacterium RIFCSPHIGHO2_12_FULL_55_13]OGG83608.1 MAG: 50S ribosomal protein L10 [Candidatus Kaiserbacteria bacterium RIFCSPLOWO2_01_FULL_55_25]
MAKTKAEKAAIIEKLEKGIKDASSAVFVHFSQLSVADETAMRRALRAEGVSYTVAKKTLIRRALERAGYKHEELPLEGEVAVALGVGDDITAAARFVHEAAKKLADKVSIIGGIFEGKVMDAVRMKEIAMIPSMATLRGMFAQVINSPRSRFAIALSEVAKKV